MLMMEEEEEKQKTYHRTLTCTRSSLTTACGGLKNSTFLRSRPARDGVEAGDEAAAGLVNAAFLVDVSGAAFLVDAGAAFFAVEGGGAAAAAAGAAASSSCAGAAAATGAGEGAATFSAGASALGSSSAIVKRRKENGKDERGEKSDALSLLLRRRDSPGVASTLLSLQQASKQP